MTTIASAMRLLDKGDDAGLAELFTTRPRCVNAEPLRALASLEGEWRRLGRLVNSSMDGVALDALDELELTLTALAALAPAPPALAVDLTVAGLDYYTGMVFEVKVEEQVVARLWWWFGRCHLFGLPDLDPCCGFGLGRPRCCA